MGILNSQESLVKKASYLRIAAADLAEGMKTGNFKSLYRGQGIEFSGAREYIRGDDIRSIDWNVTARMGRPFVKVFEEERELQIFIVLDSSLSMQLGDGRTSKYESAVETAALIAIAAEMNQCPVGAVFFDGAIHFSCSPVAGREQTMLLLTRLDKAPEEPVNGSVLGNALTGAGKLLKKRSLVFILSDFRSAGWDKPLINLAHKNDVVAIRLQNSFDIQLPEMGVVPFVDTESGEKMILPTSSERFKREWKLQNENRVRRWKDLCNKHGVTPVVMNSTDEPVKILSSIFTHKATGIKR
ncbi:MAG: DUF58 domain-containing protein [Treponema sp.]|nr:DUF58 domain-containing protein [Treponema sp.]